MRSRRLVSLLHSHGLKELKTEMKQAKSQLLRTLGELPDYSLEVLNYPDEKQRTSEVAL